MDSRPTAPGPTALPLVGAFWEIAANPLLAMARLVRRYGDVVRLPLGPRVNHLAWRPEHLRHVLVSAAGRYEKGRTFAKTRAFLGEGLATSEGERWRSQRRLMQPHFHRSPVALLAGSMAETIEAHLDRWSRHEGPLNLARAFRRLAMETTTRVLFGASPGEEAQVALNRAVRDVLDHVASRVMAPLEIPDELPLPSNLRFARAVEVLEEAVGRLVAQGPPRGTLLEDLLAREPMDPRQLRDEMITLLVAGTDTTGNSLTWACYLLSRHPRVARRLAEEARRVLGSGRPGMAHLDGLDLAARVFQETLRLYPQNWVMARDAREEDDLGGYRIPAGTTVFLGVHLTHRHPSLWERPKAFDPDRFLPEAAAGRDPFQYLPFGAGPRKCIGQALALQEAALALAMLFRRYEFHPVDRCALRPRAGWSLAPGRPFAVTLEARA